MTRYVIGIGANLGEPEAAVAAGARAVAAIPGVRVTAASHLYRTDPIGGPDQPDYANAAVLVETDLEPRALLDALRAVEAAAGRTRGVRFGPRTLDLDILWRDGPPIDEVGLVIPHPRLHERRFALEPLLELVDDRDLRAACAALPPQGVRRLGPAATATMRAIFADEG